ncbi:type II CRISPR-associated endonuclease Cas1 [bacterium]|nr:type II CRISPR-associated endonuclease Cas1 [bacterium]MBU1637632.1 type II CRISPR-associated endonuclease Cas1 [bacterium]
MIKRVVEIGSDCQLSVTNSQLIIRQNNEQVGKVPLEDLGVLVLDNAMITYTLQLLQLCAENNVAVVFCDNKHMPKSLMQSLSGHNLHSRILAAQTAVSEPIRKRLWQQIVVAKLDAQAHTLEQVGQTATMIRTIAKAVKSGDPENCEAQAAALYWRLLFGNDFRRDPEVDGINSLLNYGYAVVRAAVARAIVGTGLHPALGIHHHNQYDAYCLANDLMEPFRPAVDLCVRQLSQQNSEELAISKDTKRRLLGIFESQWIVRKKSLPFIVALQLYAAGIKRALIERKLKLDIPTASPVASEQLH